MTAGWRVGGPWPERTDAGTEQELGQATITVKVVLMGELKRLAGRREMEVRLPQGSTVRTLVKELGRLCAPAFAQRSLTKEGDLQSHVAVFINGVQMQSLGGTQAELTDGQVELMLLPMYEGG